MRIISIIAIIAFISLQGCDTQSQHKKGSTTNTIKPKVTFIELGSINCIPCKQMQPVMKAIEEKYDRQIKVIFYDVWKTEQKEYAQKYKIRLIPTQIFLDADGKEFHRHEGFYPEKEIDKILQLKGLKSNSIKG